MTTTTRVPHRSATSRQLDPMAAAAWVALVQAVTDRPPPCANDPEAWYSDVDDIAAAAARACGGCHAFAQCGTYAGLAGEVHGVWAGRDRTRRRRIVPTEAVA